MSKFWKCPHCGLKHLKDTDLQDMSEIFRAAKAEEATLILLGRTTVECPRCGGVVDRHKLLTGGYDTIPEDVETWYQAQRENPGAAHEPMPEAVQKWLQDQGLPKEEKRIPCSKCGYMTLPRIIGKTGGICKRCQKFREVASPGSLAAMSVTNAVIGAILCGIIGLLVAGRGGLGALIGMAMGAAYGVYAWVSLKADLRRSGLL